MNGLTVKMESSRTVWEFIRRANLAVYRIAVLLENAALKACAYASR